MRQKEKEDRLRSVAEHQYIEQKSVHVKLSVKNCTPTTTRVAELLPCALCEYSQIFQVSSNFKVK